MCTSGMINSRAFSGCARPQGPGDEDGVSSILSSGSSTSKPIEFVCYCPHYDKNIRKHTKFFLTFDDKDNISKGKRNFFRREVM